MIDDYTIFESATGSILRQVYSAESIPDDLELEDGEDYVTGAFDSNAYWIDINDSNTVSDRPESDIIKDKGGIEFLVGEEIRFTNTDIGETFKMTGLSDKMLNVFITEDELDARVTFTEVAITDTEVLWSSPAIGIFEIEITETFPRKSYNITLTIQGN